MFWNSVKSWIIARMVKEANRPEPLPRPRRQRLEPQPDQPIYRDKYLEEHFDPEFDASIKQIVSNLKDEGISL
jgi:hypothetical protein